MNKSAELFKISQELFPGGVNSPVRAFKSVGGNPVFFESASGAYVTDVDGTSYVDYIGSWGPMICGHTHAAVVEAVNVMSKKAFSFGACHEYEIKLAQQIQSIMPNMEMLRFVSSGTEACMAAIRLARAYTKREKIVKFAGCYHGHCDSFLVQAGSGAATLGLPDSPGVPVNVAQQTLTVEFNDLDSLRAVFEANDQSIAALIIEPVVGNAGCLLPDPGFLEGVRELCTQNKTLLIFDEVMTGFRVSPGGAQELFNINPDLTTLGKIIGGGLPVGAYGGRKDIMQMIAPSGPVYQAGTLSGNPLGMAAGLATLQQLSQPGFYQKLETFGSALENGLLDIANKKGVALTVNRCGSMISTFFSPEKQINNYTKAKTSDTEAFASFYQGMLANGVYLPPSQFEAWFFSACHAEQELEITLKAIEASL